MSKKHDVAFGMGMVGLAALAFGLWQLHEDIKEMNEHLEAIRAHAHGQHMEAMATLEEEVEET